MKLITAPITEPLCLFLVGVQCRSWTSFWKVPFIRSRMIKMQQELSEDSDSGFLWGMNFSASGPFTTLFLSYWKSSDHIHKFVSDSKFSHIGSTREYYKKFSKDSNIGIWHETYEIEPGKAENLYYGMDSFGAAGFLKTIQVDLSKKQFVQRLRGTN